MSVVTPYIENLKAIKDNIPQLAKEAIQKHSGEIIDLVRKEQLAKGLNSFNKPLKWSGGTGRYAPRTQKIATKQGLFVPKTKGAPYNFQWTGDTFDSMGLDPKGKESFKIFTIDGKQEMLESIYGEIFQLTDEHNDYVNNEIIMPYLHLHILNNLFNLK